MSDVNWSEREVSREAARRLLAGVSRTPTRRQTSLAYTRISSGSVLERRGLAPGLQQRGSSEPITNTAPAHAEVVFDARVGEPSTAVASIALSPSDLSTPPGRVSSNASAPMPETFPEPSEQDIESLEGLLEWSRGCASAQSTFLLDAQGFIIERAGEWDFELAEATGAQVLLAMDRLGKGELIGATPRALNVEYEDHCLTAIPIPAGGGEVYTLCLISKAALSPERLRHIAKSLADGVLRV